MGPVAIAFVTWSSGVLSFAVAAAFEWYSQRSEWVTRRNVLLETAPTGTDIDETLATQMACPNLIRSLTAHSVQPLLILWVVGPSALAVQMDGFPSPCWLLLFVLVLLLVFFHEGKGKGELCLLRKYQTFIVLVWLLVLGAFIAIAFFSTVHEPAMGAVPASVSTVG